MSGDDSDGEPEVTEKTVVEPKEEEPEVTEKTVQSDEPVV